MSNPTAVWGVVVLCACGMLTGCKSSAPTDPVGEYVYEINGQTVKFMKVLQAGSGYEMDFFADGKWIPMGEPVKPLSKHELGQMLTGPVDGITGLQVKNEELFLVPKGWTQISLGHNGAPNTEFKATTGYVALWTMGFMNLKKL